MKRHVLAYVRRKVITDWKRIVLTGERVQFLYGSNDDHLFAKQKDGCTLWLVCSFPGRPPALAAKLDVEKVCPIDDPALGIDESILRHFRKRKWKWIARASGDSMFFGHNDAGSALVKTVFERPSGECWSLSRFSPVWLPAFGIRFLRPRLIHGQSPGRRR